MKELIKYQIATAYPMERVAGVVLELFINEVPFGEISDTGELWIYPKQDDSIWKVSDYKILKDFYEQAQKRFNLD